MKTAFTRSDFDFDLPEDLIAQTPAAVRTQSRLLHVLPHQMPSLRDLVFSDLPSLLRPKDLLVMNDTRVIKARFFGQKASGGRVEFLVERLLSSHEALVQLRASHPPAIESEIIPINDPIARLRILGRHDRFYRVRFEHVDDVVKWLEAHGQMPLPPYIKRDADVFDESRYQTVYARHPGAVAAPTAGLHFDTALMNVLQQQGVDIAYVTLHVGAGTFQPVQEDDISKHVMHAEHYTIDETTRDKIAQTRGNHGRVIAIGTTSLRALESAADQNGNVKAGDAETRIFIHPGYTFKAVDALLTNFHLPCSTLMMLVSAFGGYDTLREAYRHAIDKRYRFFSYGDAMFLERS
ncbi:MAG: tRNA preQ1(34) S-adenosylmethionine ribosyltransferase-isomerase QueA [Burkholderiales bacterium]|nr:tRNA preQ1(34) S-adenosylmethionine ribosyltransferase-isomerase QueA [Burkholderiales bacterium]